MKPVINTLSTPAGPIRQWSWLIEMRKFYGDQEDYIYTETLPSRINRMNPHAGDDYAESPTLSGDTP